MIIPSIDLMDGKAVQLRQGRDKVLEVDDVWGLAERFSRLGDLAIVDLDAALGQGSNADLVRALCRRYPCRVGGGLREPGEAIDRLKCGARKVVIGTRAEPEFLAKLPRESVIVALDVRGESVVTDGWRRDTGRSAVDRARELTPYASGFLCTIVDKEGMLGGTDLQRLRALRAATPLPVTAAGGIRSIEEVRTLLDEGMDVQLGMALYTGALDPAELVVGLCDFAKGGGLAPTIVRDREGHVRMLAHSSPESLRAALGNGEGTYYSRRRQRLWRKGETSGNTQKLLRADLDCDRDTLLFTVEQKGPTCHLGRASCFGEAAPGFWTSLYETIRERIAEGDGASYTAGLAADPERLRAKIREEADEVCTASGHEALRFEAADLLYHLTVLLAAEGVGLDEIGAELGARRR